MKGGQQYHHTPANKGRTAVCHGNNWQYSKSEAAFKRKQHPRLLSRDPAMNLKTDVRKTQKTIGCAKDDQIGMVDNEA